MLKVPAVYHTLKKMDELINGWATLNWWILFTSDDISRMNVVFVKDCKWGLAADTQLYIHCEFHNMATSRDVLECCIQDIGHWVSANHLKLNPDKTELLWTGTIHSLGRLTDGGPRLVLGTEVIDASSFVFPLKWHSRQTYFWRSTHPSSAEGFFPATPVATCTTFTRLGSGIDAHTSIRLQLGWL